MFHHCPACQTENRPGARFCKRCGTPLTEPVATVFSAGAAADTPSECPACGNDCTPGSHFCNRCGVPLRGPDAPAAPDPAPPVDVASEPAALASRLGGVALAITLALLLVAGWFWSMQRGSESAGSGAARSASGVAAPTPAPAPASAPVSATAPAHSSAGPSALPPITLEVVAEPVAPPPGPPAPSSATLLPPPAAVAAPVASVAPAAPAAPAIQAAASATPDAAPTPRPRPTPRPAEAGARDTPTTRTPAPQTARAPTSPDDACATSSTFTRPFCLSVQCFKAQFRDHPSCVRLREQERQRQELERANSTNG